jgi:hypothetical protein
MMMGMMIHMTQGRCCCVLGSWYEDASSKWSRFHGHVLRGVLSNLSGKEGGFPAH